MQKVVTAFIRKNIAKLIIVSLLIFTATRKNVRFHINLSEPAVALEAKKKAVPPIDKGKPPGHAEQQRASLLDRFQFAWFGKNEPEEENSLSGPAVDWRHPIDPQAQDAFIRRFAHVAIAERKKFGIPSSFILANGLLQSQAGYDQRVRRGNNYFGLPCTSDWRGATITVEGQCYRAYETAWMSFRDHSLFIIRGPYTPRQPLLASDYEGWIKQLAANGYPMPGDYAARLSERIEQLQLFTIDQQQQE